MQALQLLQHKSSGSSVLQLAAGEPLSGEVSFRQGQLSDVRTSATASNFSDAAAQWGGHVLLANLPTHELAEADSPATTDGQPPLISFTPPPRQAVAKLAKMFQPGPSRLSAPGGQAGSAQGEVAASKHFSPLKHHIKKGQPAAAVATEAAGGASRLAKEAGPRESHLDFFLRDAAAASANFR